MSDNYFAFGGSEYGDRMCPSAAAGIDPGAMFDENPWYSRIADQYDCLVRMRIADLLGIDVSSIPDNIDYHLRTEEGIDAGIIPESWARELWHQAAEMQGCENDEGLDVEEALGWR